MKIISGESAKTDDDGCSRIIYYCYYYRLSALLLSRAYDRDTKGRRRGARGGRHPRKYRFLGHTRTPVRVVSRGAPAIRRRKNRRTRKQTAPDKEFSETRPAGRRRGRSTTGRGSEKHRSRLVRRRDARRPVKRFDPFQFVRYRISILPPAPFIIRSRARARTIVGRRRAAHTDATRTLSLTAETPKVGPAHETRSRPETRNHNVIYFAAVFVFCF